MSIREFKQIISYIEGNYRDQGKDPESMIEVNKSICGQVSNREPALIEFVRKHDLILFVSGKESSNGKMLYEVCKRENNASYFITSFDEINPEWIKSRESIGLCGATSTPRWLIKEIYLKLEEAFSEK